jgi:hypothetical protein
MLFLFGQVYPYVHFHHSHTDPTIALELSLHPINVEPFCVNNDHHHHDAEPSSEDSGHHQHHESEQLVDWHATRTSPNIILPRFDIVCFEDVLDDSDLTNAPLSFVWAEDSSPPELTLGRGIETRGPPETSQKH